MALKVRKKAKMKERVLAYELARQFFAKCQRRRCQWNQCSDDENAKVLNEFLDWCRDRNIVARDVSTAHSFRVQLSIGGAKTAPIIVGLKSIRS